MQLSVHHPFIVVPLLIPLDVQGSLDTLIADPAKATFNGQNLGF